MTEDVQLLSQYAAERSETAFAEFTQRHIDLVYSAALRVVNGDVHSAEDVTQQVFTEAARQEKGLASHPALVGWPDKAFLGSQADIDNFLQQVRVSNQRIVQQAGSVLAPDQLAALDTVLNNAIDTRKLQAAALIQKK